MTPDQIICNGILSRTIKNYQPRLKHPLFKKNMVIMFKQLGKFYETNDLLIIRENSELFQMLFEYSQLMPGTVREAQHLKTSYHQQLIPIALYQNGLFIGKDDARRFYNWLKINLKKHHLD